MKTLQKYLVLAACLCPLILVSACGGGEEGGSVRVSSSSSSPSPTLPLPEIPTDPGHTHVETTRTNTVHLGDGEATTLSQEDTLYILDTDIQASGTALTITAGNITLDLNGHTVTYATAVGNTPSYGIRVAAFYTSDVVIKNGSVVQGAGALNTWVEDGVEQQRHWHPVYVTGPRDIVITGLNLVYRTPDTSAIYINYIEGADVYGNTSQDLGNIVTNRHQQYSAFVHNANGSGLKVHDNTVLSVRQSGIIVGKDSIVYNNNIHIDSVCTNSFGILAFNTSGFVIHDNVITGEGAMPVGIGVVAGAENGSIYGNNVTVQTTIMNPEYITAVDSAAFRTTWGANNVDVYNNTFILKAKKDFVLVEGVFMDSRGRAVWVGLPEPGQKMWFRNNLIVAENNGGDGAKAAAVGIVSNNRSHDLIFEGNTIVSNWSPILLADSYGECDGFPRFINNTIRKTDNDPDYRTIRSQMGYIPSTAIFVNTTWEGGASFEDMDLLFTLAGAVGDYGWYDNKVKKEVSFGHRVTIAVTQGGAAALNARVDIYDEELNKVFEGWTDASGEVVAHLAEWAITNRITYFDPSKLTLDYLPGVRGANRLEKGDFTVEVTYDGASRLESVVSDADKTVTIAF